MGKKIWTILTLIPGLICEQVQMINSSCPYMILMNSDLQYVWHFIYFP